MRRFANLAFCLLVAGLLGISSYVAEAVEPILWFSFEDSGDTAKDASGNGNDGTIVGADIVAGGKYGKGLEVGKEDEYVQITNILEPQTTVEFWFKPNWDGTDIETYRLFDACTAPIYFLIGKGKEPGSKDQTFGLYLEDSSDKDFQNWLVPAAGTIEAGNWYHIAATWDFDAGEAKFYINGEEISSVAGLGEFPTLNDNPTIGYNNDSGNMASANGADAIMDEFLIYNVVLGIDDIAKDMKRTIIAVEPSDKLSIAWGKIKSER